MIEKLALYFSIFISSTVKFIAGPTIGVAAGLSVVETATLTALGMMLTVVLFTLFGPQMRSFIARFRKKKRKLFTKRNRRFVRIWQKYGIPGTAILTPLILTPVGGAILANAFKGPKNKIFLYMTLSAVFWGFTLTWSLKYLRDLLML